MKEIGTSTLREAGNFRFALGVPSVLVTSARLPQRAWCDQNKLGCKCRLRRTWRLHNDKMVADQTNYKPSAVFADGVFAASRQLACRRGEFAYACRPGGNTASGGDACAGGRAHGFNTGYDPCARFGCRVSKPFTDAFSGTRNHGSGSAGVSGQLRDRRRDEMGSSADGCGRGNGESAGHPRRAGGRSLCGADFSLLVCACKRGV
ncbi:hypothetical protein SDC9_158682 [bioreactor metagenome]|uniref:Uncharacterized protein n=1 Tax=bioreactor metagenome TaxID=1076179 RepID=A0A645FAQ1_9ZZZZ